MDSQELARKLIPSSTMEKAHKDLEKRFGDNWDSPRTKLYVAATITSMQDLINRLEFELSMEKEITKRVLASVK
jgi:hypothetical protein